MKKLKGKKTLKFTKKQVISAVMNEPLPLRGGKFIFEGQNGKACNVCAVGAVMRKTLPGLLKEYDDMELAEALTDNTYCDTDSLEGALADGNYLGALSIFFENLYNERFADKFYTKMDDEKLEYDDAELRLELLNFVLGLFPDKFEVQIKPDGMGGLINAKNSNSNGPFEFDDMEDDDLFDDEDDTYF